MFWLFLVAVLQLADPAGDAHGDGGYLLPIKPPISADALDLRSFEAEEVGSGMKFVVGFGGHQNPWNLPSGFSAGVTDIFVKSDAGGENDLSGLRLRAAGAQGWHYHLRVSGAGTLLEKKEGDQLTRLAAPSAQQDGPNLRIDAPDFPAGHYSYWVTSSVFTPFSPTGRLAPGPTHAASGLYATRDSAPVPVDVLAAPEDRRAYTDGTLQSLGQDHDWRLLTLLGLSGLGLVLGLLGLLRLRRSRP